MKIVSQVDSAEYYEHQAIIEISEAQSMRVQSFRDGGYRHRILKAIQLLVLALCSNR